MNVLVYVCNSVYGGNFCRSLVYECINAIKYKYIFLCIAMCLPARIYLCIHIHLYMDIYMCINVQVCIGNLGMGVFIHV